MVIDSETFTGSLGDVRAFCEVVDFGSVTAAARRLGQSKGAISRRITRLEAALGVRLLARTSRAVTATEEGLVFHAKAQAGLALLDEASDTARGHREVPRGHLRITTAVDLSVELLPPLIVGFRARYPQISVEIIATDTSIDLAAHRIDVALRIGIGELPDLAYRGVELARGSMGFYAAPAWLAQRRLPDTPAGLAGSDLIISEKQGAGRGFPFSNAQAKISEVVTRAATRASDLATVLRLAEVGGGIAVLPALITARAVAAGTLVPVLPAWRLPGLRLHALTLVGRDVPARVRLFSAFLKETLAQAKYRALVALSYTRGT